MSEKTEPAGPMLVEMAQKKHRPIPEIMADLSAARAELGKMQPIVAAHVAKREAAKASLERAKQEWAKNPVTSAQPFDPARYIIDLTIPPEETPQTIAYHRQHYAVANLENELHAAKAAIFGTA